MPAILSPKYCCSPSQVCPGAGKEAFQARLLSANGAPPHVHQHLFMQGTVVFLLSMRGSGGKGQSDQPGATPLFSPACPGPCYPGRPAGFSSTPGFAPTGSDLGVDSFSKL